jgi:GNAT superfamily N-acetyltransferase
VTATDIALLNDLLVVAGSRSKGVGRLLISAAMTNAKEHGCSRLVWQTAPDNDRAQRLYDQFAATRSEWIEYSVALR